MLLNPATARMSIQFVQIDSRITRLELPSMPIDANCVILSTINEKQKFYHVCKDNDVSPEDTITNRARELKYSTVPSNNFR